MSRKRILLVDGDGSLRSSLEHYLGNPDSVVSIQTVSRSKQKMDQQTFPLIIIEARENWYRNLQRLYRLNRMAENATILVAPPSLLRHHADCLKPLSLAALGDVNPSGAVKTFTKPPEELRLKDFVEGKLRDFVRHMKKSGVRNLYSMLLGEVERPLFSYILKETNGNQIRAAQLLGINRNTLRKKIKELKIALKQPTRVQSRK